MIEYTIRLKGLKAEPDAIGRSTMEALHMLKNRLARLRAGRIDPRSDEILQRLLARIRASHPQDDLILDGFPGLGELSDERALQYWEGKVHRVSRHVLREDDLAPDTLVLAQAVLSSGGGDMPWDDNSSQKLVGQSFRILAVQLPFVLLEPASRAFSNGEPVSLDVRRLTLIRCSPEFFDAQRGIPRSHPPADGLAGRAELPF